MNNSLKITLVSAAIIAGTAAGMSAASAGSKPAVPLKGPVPAAAFQQSGVNTAIVPAWIPALDRSGNQVGYVQRDLVMPQGNSAGVDRAVPVYADDLKTVVGRMVPGRGFVQKGAPDASTPMSASGGSADG